MLRPLASMIHSILGWDLRQETRYFQKLELCKGCRANPQQAQRAFELASLRPLYLYDGMLQEAVCLVGKMDTKQAWGRQSAPE